MWKKEIYRDVRFFHRAIQLHLQNEVQRPDKSLKVFIFKALGDQPCTGVAMKKTAVATFILCLTYFSMEYYSWLGEVCHRSAKAKRGIASARKTAIKKWASRIKMKKHSERCKHCSLAVVRWSQKFSPRLRPPSRRCEMAKI